MAETNKPFGTKAQDEKNEVKPLLNIELPIPSSGNPMSPISFDTFNKYLKSNFSKVGNLFQAMVSNQKTMSILILKQQEEIKELRKRIDSAAELIRETLGEQK